MLFDKGDFNRSVCNEVVRRAVGEGGGREVLLEIGANIGTQTIYANLAHRFRRTIAVEPDLENLMLLRANIRLNALADAVVVCPCAVSDAAGSVRLVRRIHNSGGTTIHPGRIAALREGQARLGRENDTNVPLIRGDDLIASHGVGSNEIALVWIDVEGHEAAALRGMPGILAARPPLFFEFTPEWMSAEDRQSIEDAVFGHYTRIWRHEDDFAPIDRDAFRRIDGQTDILALS